MRIVLFLALLLISTPLLAQEKQETPACTPVAKVFDETICYESFKAKRLRNKHNEVKSLRDHIWSIGLKRKFPDKNFDPSEEEIIAYRKAFHESMESSYEANKKIYDLAMELLEKNEYSAGHNYKIENIASTAAKSIDFFEERQRTRQSMAPEYRKIMDETQDKLNADHIRQWKINKALFDMYGGNLIYQATGMEPVDAQSEFLEYLYKEGNLEVVDENFKNVFDSLEEYKNNKQAHNVLEGKQEIYEDYFTTPYWQFEQQAKAVNFEEAAERMKKLPVLRPKETEDEDLSDQ